MAKARERAERNPRISEKAMARKPNVDAPQVETVIPSAGHH
jgi:hypothetical protein